MKATLIFFSFLIAAHSASAQARKSLKNDLNSLGTSPAVTERVKNLDSRQKVRVVQNRSVDRNNRIELGVHGGISSAADSYVSTQNAGAALQYHINPRWSLGVEYQKAFNKITPEGQRQYTAAEEAQNSGNGDARFAAIDYVMDTKMAMASFYPIYGKMNLFDSGIAQFDVYTTLGYGQRTLRSGNTNVMMAAIGTGVWFTSYLTGRIEGRYQRYTDLVQTEKRQQNVFQVQAALGIFVW